MPTFKTGLAKVRHEKAQKKWANARFYFKSGHGENPYKIRLFGGSCPLAHFFSQINRDKKIMII